MSDPTLNQDEIDALLADVGDGAAGDSGSDLGGGDDFSTGMDDMGAPSAAASDDDLSALLGGDDAPAPAAAAPAPPAPRPAAVAHRQESAMPLDIPQGNLEVLLDVPLEVVVELGRADLQVKDILGLAPGSVVELNRMAGEAIDILVNGKLVARGEVVVVDENFGVKITSIISPMERLTQLN